MNITGDCIRLIKHYESLADVKSDGLIYPYTDAAGYPTIGYGTRFYEDGREVSLLDPPIEKNRALMLLTSGVEQRAEKVKSLLKVPVCSHQFDAMVSLAYNIGVGAFETSTLLKKVNAGAKRKEVSKEFMRWVYSGGKRLAGLVKRRNTEAILYEYGKLEI